MALSTTSCIEFLFHCLMHKYINHWQLAGLEEASSRCWKLFKILMSLRIPKQLQKLLINPYLQETFWAQHFCLTKERRASLVVYHWSGAQRSSHKPTQTDTQTNWTNSITSTADVRGKNVLNIVPWNVFNSLWDRQDVFPSGDWGIILPFTIKNASTHLTTQSAEFLQMLPIATVWAIALEVTFV